MGRLIIIEGLDRAGKTIQSEKLTEHLGPDCTLLKFPDRTTEIGKMIDAYLRSSSELSDEAIHLLFSANRWECAEKIKKLLQKGDVVVDRYTFSGVAFSAAKGLDREWCAAPDRGLPKPDLVLFLDVSTAVAEQRGGYGQERYERREFQHAVREQFKAMQDGWAWISADADIDQVHKDIVAAVSRV